MLVVLCCVVVVVVVVVMLVVCVLCLLFVLNLFLSNDLFSTPHGMCALDGWDIGGCQFFIAPSKLYSTRVAVHSPDTFAREEARATSLTMGLPVAKSVLRTSLSREPLGESRSAETPRCNNCSC